MNPVLIVYLVGLFIWYVGLGISTALYNHTVEGFAVLFFVGLIWPLPLLLLIGNWVGQLMVEKEDD